MVQHEHLMQVAQAIRNARTIALCSHVNPDGDTIGTASALRIALHRMGKQVEWFCQNPVPDHLRILNGSEACRLPESLGENERFDLLLCVDISDDYRMGRAKVLLERCDDSAQIDHHGTNPQTWTRCAAVDGHASACAVVAWELLGELGAACDRDMAESLYAGISTDTGNFAYSITPEAMRITADLVEQGLLDVQEMHRRLFEEHDPAAVKLLQRALASMVFSEDGTVTTMMLTREDFAACGATQQHADTLVNYGLRIRGVRAALLAREAMTGDSTNGVKLSFRSVKPLDISVVACRFGGGGHAQACGATIMDKPITQVVDEARAAMLEAVRGEMDKETETK